MTELNIAEIPYETGRIKFRYSRYLSNDGSHWIRHGLFQAYSEDGVVISEGNYTHGLESGLWSDYHSNGVLAARGSYVQGKEHGLWLYFNNDGVEEKSITYSYGKTVV